MAKLKPAYIVRTNVKTWVYDKTEIDTSQANQVVEKIVCKEPCVKYHKVLLFVDIMVMAGNLTSLQQTLHSGNL